MDDHSRPASAPPAPPAGAAGRTSGAVDALLDLQSGYWAGGEPRPVEALLDLRPGLRDDPDVVLDLVYHEVLLRQQRGETPRLDEYAARFPRLADALRAQFEVHHALHREPSPLSTVTAAPARPAPTLPAVEGYEVLAELGRGGMGVVYQARHVGLKRLVALKMLRAEAVEGGPQRDRFRSEAEAMARLEHPNIVRVYEVGEHEGRPFFAMELVTGGSLERRLNGAPQPPVRSARLLETLARAVHVAHARQLVHRDLKPANILLEMQNAECRMQHDEPEPTADPSFCILHSAFCVPKITDFGLAKRLDDGDRRTRSGDILGTPCYMAPEQAFGRNEAVGPRTDVWALGAILYELLTGRPPFRGETVWDTLQQVGRQDPVPPRRLQPKVPRDLETVCLKCLHKEPARRYASALALADDLGRFLAGRPIKARPLPWWEQAWRGVRRRPTAAACVAVTLALGAAHYAHLHAELARERFGAALAEVEVALGRADVAGRDGNWEGADTLLRDAVLPRLTAAEAERPGAAELAALRDKAEGLAALASRRLTWRGRLATLAECRADAGFFATPFAGQDVRSNRARTRAAVERALALFPDAAGGAPGAPCHGLSAAESLTAREGCCELLLHLAAVTLEPAAGEDAGRRRADAEEALRILDRAAGYGVDTPILAGRRAACLARLGREADAAKEQTRAGAELRRTFEWFLRGNDLFRGGEVQKAAGHYEKALSREPDHFGALYALGVCYLRLAADGPDQRRANVQLAQVHLTHCVRKHPGRVWPFIQLGLARGEAGDSAGAEEDFARAERLLVDGPDPTALYGVLVNRGLVRVRHKNADGAVADLTRAVALRPGDWQAYVNLAAAYTEQGRRAEAAAQLDKAVALKPAGGLAAVHRNRARLCQQAGDLVAAADELGQAAAAEPAGSVAARADDRLRRARLLEQAGRHEDAIAAADDALRLRPDSPPAHRTRAEALLHLGRYAEAVAALDRCLDRGGAAERAAVYEARARARTHLGDHASAAEDFTRTLGCRPDDPAALTGRGWAYVALEANALAERDFDRAVRLGPGDADALLGRAYVRVKAASLAEGLRDAEEALRPGRREPQLLFDAARVFARAARRVEDDPARQGPSGLQERGRLEGRALDLLRAALESLPADRQAPFWSQRVERDAALGPLKRTAAYRQMAGTFARSGAGTPR